MPKFTEGEFVRTPRAIRTSDGKPVEGVKLNLEVDGDVPFSVTTSSGGEGEKIKGDTMQQLFAYPADDEA